MSVVVPQPIETKDTESHVPESRPEEREADILKSVLAAMKTSAKQLIKKLKSNKDVVGWNNQGHMVLDGRTISGKNVIGLVNDTL